MYDVKAVYPNFYAVTKGNTKKSDQAKDIYALPLLGLSQYDDASTADPYIILEKYFKNSSRKGTALTLVGKS